MIVKKERIVVKIGSSSLTRPDGSLSRTQLNHYVKELASLRALGHEVILISSGAVAAGISGLKYPSRPVTLPGKQAAAAVGQGLLMQAYTEAFNKYDIETGQILLTRSNFSNKEQYQNAYATLTELLRRGVLPIINENDSIAVDELTFGDNDMLSALVGGLIHADCLLIITDINGIYDANPKETPDAKKYHFITEITEDLYKIAGGSGSNVGTGGMRSKLEAAETALNLGLRVFIGVADKEGSLVDIMEGKGDGTYIGFSGQYILTNKKQWLLLHSLPAGEVYIDDGAKKALLHKGKSLLPVGVVKVTGYFESGAVVEVKDEKGNLLGKGQVNMSFEELDAIKGKTTKEASEQINMKRPEVIHRDDWVDMTKERFKYELNEGTR